MDFKIRHGLDLPIEGHAEQRVTDARYVRTYAVKPTDFVGLVPRLLVAEGGKVKAGDALFCDKTDERIRFASPVEGTVKAVVRGEKRLLQAVVVEKGGEPASPIAIEGTMKERMLGCGLWPILRQRPFGTVANPDVQPKAVVISCFDSAPLSPDYDFALQGRYDEFCKGIEALAEVAQCPIHLCFRPNQKLETIVKQYVSHGMECHIHTFEGPHPAGNVGTQIARLCPINKGETVWTVQPQDVAVLGHFAITGAYVPERLIAVAGPHIKHPHYYRIAAGACISSIAAAQCLDPEYPRLDSRPTFEGDRFISGNILSGTQIAPDGFIGAYDSLLSILPEGNYYDFMGWLMPGIRKYSFSRTFASGFVPQWAHFLFPMLPPMLKPKFDTNTHGDVRPLVFTGNFERVFPFDIYPTQLIKACIIGDIELQENLGIYEVEPEDFALCEYIDTSKTDIQPIIREALEKLRKEAL